MRSASFRSNEATDAERAAKAVAPRRQHMLMVLAIGALADRVALLEQAGALPVRVRILLSDLAVWLVDDSDNPEGAARLRGRIDGFEPLLGHRPGWTMRLLASLTVRPRVVIDLRQDLRALRGHVTAGTASTAPLGFAYTARGRSIRYPDDGLAAFSTFGVFVGPLACCAVASLPAGPTAPQPR